jgi:hypothetical protein
VGQIGKSSPQCGLMMILSTTPSFWNRLVLNDLGGEGMKLEDNYTTDTVKFPPKLAKSILASILPD